MVQCKLLVSGSCVQQVSEPAAARGEAARRPAGTVGHPATMDHWFTPLGVFSAVKDT